MLYHFQMQSFDIVREDAFVWMEKSFNNTSIVVYT